MEVDFTGSGSTDDIGIESYLWDFGDGVGSSTEADPTYTYTTEGNYTATLTVTDGEGATDTSNVSITVNGSGSGGCVGVSLPWISQDIGAVAASGDSCEGSGTFELNASGSDIWNSEDEFHYVYQSLSGDGEIVARVVSLDNTDPWAKAGIMMRNTLDANSAMVFMFMSSNPRGSGPSYSFQHRNFQGEVMNSTTNDWATPEAVGFPYYFRLVRQGDIFTSYVSPTNGNWVLLGSRTVTMETNIYVGLAVTSHNDGVLAQAVFDDVTVQGLTEFLPNQLATPNEDLNFENVNTISKSREARKKFDLDRNENTAFILTPNPSKSEVEILFPPLEEKSVVITVLDMNGRRLDIIKTDEASNSAKLDLTGYQEGMYLISIKSGDKNIQRKLLVKK